MCRPNEKSLLITNKKSKEIAYDNLTYSKLSTDLIRVEK